MATFNTGDVLTAANLQTAAGDSGWVGVSGGVGFTNSWVTAGGFTVAYRLLGREVAIKGRISGGTGGASCFTLPSAYRPSQQVSLVVWDNTATAAIKITINTDGTVVPTTTTGNTVILDNIQFAVG